MSILVQPKGSHRIAGQASFDWLPDCAVSCAPTPRPTATNTFMTEKRPHPHFDDKGTLDWHTSFAEAKQRARDEGKLIFVEFGREL